MRLTRTSNGAVRSTAAALLLAAATSCASTKQSVGIDSVDSLVSRVERVHLEVELSKQAVYEALVSLGPLMVEDFRGDAAVTLEAFARSTSASERQANTLRNHVAPMRNAAEVVFQTWAKNLEEFASPSMRERSQRRLDETRERFADVYGLASVSQTDLDDINSRLRDLVLFLGHDFNATSVQEVRDDAYSIRDDARALGKKLDACMDAAATYVETSALRGQVETTVTETPEEAPPAKAAQ